MKKFIIILIALASLLLIVLFDIYFFEPNLLILKNEKIYLKNWNKKADGLKIAVITDLHLGTYRVDLKKVKHIVNKINAQKPDFIFILGDLDAKAITQKKYELSDISKILSGLKASKGIYAIMGNHDMYPMNIVKYVYLKANIPVLENKEDIVNYNGAKIKITGLKDMWYFGFDKSIVTKNDDNCLIVLSHNPDAFAKMPEYVSITLSGHTHGGEIYIPIIGSPFVPSIYGQKYRKGLVIENGKTLYVSGGVASLSRIRFLNPPEISVITLYSANGKYIHDTKIKKGINKNYADIGFKFLRHFYKN